MRSRKLRQAQPGSTQSPSTFGAPGHSAPRRWWAQTRSGRCAGPTRGPCTPVPGRPAAGTPPPAAGPAGPPPQPAARKATPSKSSSSSQLLPQTEESFVTQTRFSTNRQCLNTSLSLLQSALPPPPGPALSLMLHFRKAKWSCRAPPCCDHSKSIPSVTWASAANNNTCAEDAGLNDGCSTYKHILWKPDKRNLSNHSQTGLFKNWEWRARW